MKDCYSKIGALNSNPRQHQCKKNCSTPSSTGYVPSRWGPNGGASPAGNLSGRANPTERPKYLSQGQNFLPGPGLGLRAQAFNAAATSIIDLPFFRSLVDRRPTPGIGSIVQITDGRSTKFNRRSPPGIPDNDLPESGVTWDYSLTNNSSADPWYWINELQIGNPIPYIVFGQATSSVQIYLGSYTAFSYKKVWTSPVVGLQNGVPGIISPINLSGEGFRVGASQTLVAVTSSTRNFFLKQDTTTSGWIMDPDTFIFRNETGAPYLMYTSDPGQGAKMWMRKYQVDYSFRLGGCSSRDIRFIMISASYASLKGQGQNFLQEIGGGIGYYQGKLGMEPRLGVEVRLERNNTYLGSGPGGDYRQITWMPVLNFFYNF